MGKKTIILDVDGPLADFYSTYKKLVSKHLGITWDLPIMRWDIGDAMNLSPEQKDVVHKYLNAPDVAAFMPLCPGAQDGVEGLLEDGHDVWFLTAPLQHSPTWCFDRLHWVERFFGKEMRDKTIFASRKELVRGDIFVDDKPQNIYDWVKANPQGLPVLWATESNTAAAAQGAVYTSSWETVRRLGQT